MGSSASKAARKLPKRAEPSFSAKPRAPHPETHPETPPPRASERKTEAIERDAQDPHFLANLSRLGPVQVDHHMQTVRVEAANTKRLFESRAQSEYEASSTQPTRNRLTALTLTELLDTRKGARTQADFEQLANKYGIDLQKMQSVAQFVSSPSVDSSKTIRTVGKEGEEEVMMPAAWVEPSLQDSPRIQS